MASDKKYASQTKYTSGGGNIRIIGKNDFQGHQDQPLPQIASINGRFKSINDRKIGGGAKTCMSRNQKIKTNIPVPLALNQTMGQIKIDGGHGTQRQDNGWLLDSARSNNSGTARTGPGSKQGMYTSVIIKNSPEKNIAVKDYTSQKLELSTVNAPRSSHDVDRAKSLPRNRATIGHKKYNLSVSD